jgi:hypothetical protein
LEGGALNAYKFLRPGGIGPFSGMPWRAGEWVEGERLSACERRHLPLWIWEELWEIELEGEVVSRAHKLRASRARLGRRIEAWSPDTAKAFARACARNGAAHAAGPLRDAGLADVAGVFADAEDLSVVTSITEDLLDDLSPELRRTVGMASDAAGSALSASASDDAYVAAKGAAEASYIAAMVAESIGGAAAYEAERERQADWLARELGLL